MGQTLHADLIHVESLATNFLMKYTENVPETPDVVVELTRLDPGDTDFCSWHVFLQYLTLTILGLRRVRD
jgi:hypothetical protein